MIIWYRLLRDDSECREKDPAKADLFFVPAFAKPKSFAQWNTTCSDDNKMPRALEDILRLKYFNATTACRHFFAVSKGHYNAKCKGWFYMPVGILKDTLRLSYSYLPTRDQLSDETVYVHDSFEDGAKAFPNVYSVPYPSSIHWSPLQNAIPPWAHQSKEDRKTLMLFIGSDNHGDVQVRRLVHQMCNSYQDNSICRYERFRLDATLLKGTAQFCLEPGGDSPWRKSISDSIAMGCIPVTFSEATSGVAPWHWRSWRSLGQVPVHDKHFSEVR
jgi:hypothetical protein